MNIIVVNQDNIISSANNIFRYKFRNSVNLADTEVALSSIAMYYSWYNISAELGNNTFYITTRVGVVNTINTITIPDGIYNIVDLNEYFQQWSITNGFYLIDSIGEYRYFAQFTINDNRYSVDVITYPVPTALPATFTQPSNWIGYPTQNYNPVLKFPSKFNDLVGYAIDFTTSLNLGVNTILSYQSSTSPDVSANTETILIAIDNIDNKYTNQSSIIYALTSSVNAGAIIYEKPPNFIFSPFIKGTYSEIYIRFLNSNYQPIHIVDPNITLTFTLRNRHAI